MEHKGRFDRIVTPSAEMRLTSYIACVSLLAFGICAPCLAQDEVLPVQDKVLTIKNGETIELARPYSVTKCKNNMKGPVTAEILVGPPQLRLSLKEAMVAPRSSPDCKEPIPGAILSLTANDVTEKFTGLVVVRWRYERNNGTWHAGRSFTLNMLP